MRADDDGEANQEENLDDDGNMLLVIFLSVRGWIQGRFRTFPMASLGGGLLVAVQIFGVDMAVENSHGSIKEQHDASDKEEASCQGNRPSAFLFYFSQSCLYAYNSSHLPPEQKTTPISIVSG